MEMSVREARAHFATALAAAERGEQVTITKNGKPIAQLGPPPAKKGGLDWDRLARVRAEMGLDKIVLERPLDDEWLAEFNDPAWMKALLGPDYYDDEPADGAP
ncbi:MULTISPECIES: type II toxin-antitoxin system prevent-host-death family antitoxin [unclassified Sphingomonas]|uniref:type II toxin-antitoxin system Phd/YefM family antitoxin n=1 Tax=unclassified Sphingomonas TaxID=196159 RepID=UPI001F57F2E7|nr:MULTISPECIES: type II toxin-antitoxin system prevent-host-death family antitoxin [unclassified Sphingomonas]